MTARVDAVLLDLLMAVMDSMSVWATATGDRATGLVWRDATTEAMRGTSGYVPYERLVADAAAAAGVPPEAPERLLDAWGSMRPWPDAAALHDLRVAYGFVTNCSSALAHAAAAASGLAPSLILTAEEAGCYKPDPRIYRMACARLGVAADRVLFVAGAPYDAAGAREAGLQSVLVRRRADQAAGDLPVVESLTEVVTSLEG